MSRATNGDNSDAGTKVAPRYNAKITVGGLMAAEGRIVAKLMADGALNDAHKWKRAIQTENVLQKRSPRTAHRQADLIAQRLRAFNTDGLTLVANGSRDTSRQLLLAATLVHSNLLSDFFTEVLKPKHRQFEPQLSHQDWHSFFAECIQRQPDLDTFSDSTKAKLREIAWKVLREAGYISSVRSPTLSPIVLTTEVITYLEGGPHRQVLNNMDFAHDY
jgi:hypothetical protein